MFVVKDKMSKLVASKTRVPPKPRKEDSRVHSEFSPYAVPVQPSNDVICYTLSPVYDKAISRPYLEQCFEKVTELGEGSYGVVYKALCKDDKKWYAIKKYKRPFKDHLHRKRLLEVVQKHMQISCNENIVKCVHAWEEAGHLYIQMELCSGTLYQYLADWKEINEHTLWNIMLDLLLGIQHLHSQEFIHLDIKPENILVTDEGVFKLGDFGLIQQITDNSVNNAEDGDARYLAPEVLQEIFSKAADIFSLGMTLLEVATDIVLPDQGPLWHELRNGTIPEALFLNTSKEFRDVICRMLSRDPLARPTVEQLLQHHRLRTLQITRSCLYLPYRMLWTIKHCYLFTKNAVSMCGLFVSQVLGFRKGQSGQDSESAVTPIKKRSFVSSTPCSTLSEDTSFGTESSGEDAERYWNLSPCSSSNFEPSQRLVSLSPLSRHCSTLLSCKKRLLQADDSSCDDATPRKSRFVQRNGRSLQADDSSCDDATPRKSRFLQTDISQRSGRRLFEQSCLEGENSEETSGYSSINASDAPPSPPNDMAADEMSIPYKIREKRTLEPFSMVLRKRAKTT